MDRPVLMEQLFCIQDAKKPDLWHIRLFAPSSANKIDPYKTAVYLQHWRTRLAEQGYRIKDYELVKPDFIMLVVVPIE